MQRRDPPSERRDITHRVAIRQQVAHVAFTFAEAAMNEQRVEPARRQALRQCDRLNGRPANVQARDESDDAHRRDCTMLAAARALAMASFTRLRLEPVK